MVCIRQATVDDLLQMQRCNLLCLPENYQLKVRARPVQLNWSIADWAAPERSICPSLRAVLLLPCALLAPAALRG